MEKCELEKIVKFDYWHDEDPDQDVFVEYQGELRCDKKRNVLKLYLEQLKEKLEVYEAEEEKEKKLRLFYKFELEKSKIFNTKYKIAPKTIPLVLTDFETDAEGNFYVSDDS